MKNNKQRYCLVFHSRASEAISAEEKQAHFFHTIRDIPVPWGLGDRSPPPAPKFGSYSSAVTSLTKFLDNGVKRAMMTFVYRRLLEDKGSSDDGLMITLDPSKVDLQLLIYTVIPKYVEAFGAYLVEYFDDQLIDLAWEEREEEGRVISTSKSKVHIDPRYKVEQVNVVSFFDELLCRRAFNLSPAEMLGRLQGKVEHARLLHGGVYIVGSSHTLLLSDAQRLCREMTAALFG